MFDVILYQPEIPPNTGNIIRLCANTGARLHLVKPLGFTLEDKQLLRAGLDYHEFATMTVHESWPDCVKCFKARRLFAVSTKGTQRYDLVDYANGDTFVFGPESRGLPPQILQSVPNSSVSVFPWFRETAASTSPTQYRWSSMKHGGRSDSGCAGKDRKVRKLEMLDKMPGSPHTGAGHPKTGKGKDYSGRPS